MGLTQRGVRKTCVQDRLHEAIRNIGQGVLRYLVQQTQRDLHEEELTRKFGMLPLQGPKDI